VTAPFQRHGGNLRQVAARWGVPEDLLDFSVNTHPFGPPRAALAAARRALARASEYPDPDAADLAEAVALAHGLSSRSVLPGNGATELIDLLPRALGVRKALVVAPTYGEYGEAVRRAGGAVQVVWRERLDRFPVAAVEDAIERGRCDLVILCSPNNPTGDRIDDGAFHRVLAACETVGARLLLDEAFVDYDEGGSRVGLVARRPLLMVLRGFTKFYALAGLRAGYLAAAPEVVRLLKDARPPWSVNRVAEAAALACLGLPGYAARERGRMAGLRQDFSASLGGLGLTVAPSAANFLLCHLPEAAPGADRLYEGLAREGFLVRHCGSFGLGDRYLRLRVHLPEANAALLPVLARHLTPRPAPHPRARAAGEADATMRP
jgi:threonine-phosphate decarboxylase